MRDCSGGVSTSGIPRRTADRLIDAYLETKPGTAAAMFTLIQAASAHRRGEWEKPKHISKKERTARESVRHSLIDPRIEVYREVMEERHGC